MTPEVPSAHKIGIVANLNKEGVRNLLIKLRDWFSKREIVVQDTESRSIDEVLQDASLVICLGGDGTMLMAADHMKEKPVPVLGVNLGRVGFLTEVKETEILDELKAYFVNQYQVEDRLMLACSIRNQKTKSQSRRFIALNDIVISREGLTRLVRVDVHVSGEKLTSFAGDGLIIATPTGSTAYSLSAGGAIVHPKLEAIVITPICPHASSLRPIVVGGSEKITVRIIAGQDGAKALVTADGQENFEIDDSYSVEITRSNAPFKLFKSSKRSYFATLGENFKFPT